LNFHALPDPGRRLRQSLTPIDVDPHCRLIVMPRIRHRCLLRLSRSRDLLSGRPIYYPLYGPIRVRQGDNLKNGEKCQKALFGPSNQSFPSQSIFAVSVLCCLALPLEFASLFLMARTDRLPLNAQFDFTLEFIFLIVGLFGIGISQAVKGFAIWAAQSEEMNRITDFYLRKLSGHNTSSPAELKRELMEVTRTTSPPSTPPPAVPKWNVLGVDDAGQERAALIPAACRDDVFSLAQRAGLRQILKIEPA
jgi:hypothetical protein